MHHMGVGTVGTGVDAPTFHPLVCKVARSLHLTELSLLSSETLSEHPQRSRAKEFNKWALGSRSQTYSQTRASEYETDRSDNDHFSCMHAS